MRVTPPSSSEERPAGWSDSGSVRRGPLPHDRVIANGAGSGPLAGTDRPSDGFNAAGGVDGPYTAAAAARPAANNEAAAKMREGEGGHVPSSNGIEFDPNMDENELFEYWNERIQYHSINGKIRLNWQVRGKALVNPNSDGETDFIDVGSTYPGNIKILVPDDVNGRSEEYKELLDAAGRSGIGSSLNGAPTGYVLLSRADQKIGNLVGEATPHAVVKFRMWAHKSRAPDSRGYHNRIDWNLILPEEEAIAFVESIKLKPGILDRLFKEKVSGFVADDQMWRVKVKKLCVVEPSGLSKVNQREAKAEGITYVALDEEIGEYAGNENIPAGATLSPK